MDDITIELDESEILSIKYLPVNQAIYWDQNPKEHDLQNIAESIQKHGFQDPGKFDPNLNGGEGGIIFGNGRTYAVKYMQDHGFDRPKGIGVVKDTGEWAVPILFGNNLDSESHAIAFALDHNMIGIVGVGGITHLEASRIYDPTVFMELAIKTVEHSVTTTWEDIEVLSQLASAIENPTFDDLGVADDTEFPEKEEKPKNTYSLKFSDEMIRDEFVEFLQELEDLKYETEKMGDLVFRLLKEC